MTADDTASRRAARFEAFYQESRKTDPRCQKCGNLADWTLSRIGRFASYLDPGQVLCHRCMLGGVPPVHVPVFSDPPAEIPLHRFPHERHGEGTMPWLGFELEVAVLGPKDYLRGAKFIDRQFIGSGHCNIPEVFGYLAQEAALELVVALSEHVRSAPPADHDS